MQDNIYNNAVIISYGMLIIMFIVFVASAIVVFMSIIIPTVKYEKKLSEITKKINEKDGDLTQRITVCTSDEVGKLVKGVNLFIITLRKIMQEIVSSSADLSDTFYKVNDSISEVNKNTGDISVAMEEVAATMDTVATTIHDINDHTVRVSEAINEVTDVTRDIHAHTREMKLHAEDLERTATTNKNGTDEIRQLADSSRETANKIQNINSLVISAVNEFLMRIYSIISLLQIILKMVQ